LCARPTCRIVRNGVDATLAGGGEVAIDWTSSDGLLELHVDDDGPGLPDTSNLFVPFFTTKPTGSGIGLALRRQIAEAHAGALALESRAGRGCRATLRLPLFGA
jgi:signal transduction histidine kinase